MARRLTRIALTLGASLLACNGGYAFAKSSPPKPNILLIVVDDLGYTDLGSYGSEIPTPNLDRLADEGLKFSDFHAGMTCSPTRSMLLTGVDHHKAGLGNMAEELSPNQKGKPGYEGYLNFAVAPLPALLRNHGYRTFMTGKWHLGLSEETGPHARGFDRSFALLQGAAGHFSNMLPIVGPNKALYRDDDKMVTKLPDDFYSTRFYTDKMIEYLKEGDARQQAKPFFAYLAYTAPHFPIQAPDDSIAKFHGRYDDGYDALFTRRLAAAKRLGLIPTTTQGSPRNPDGIAWAALSPEQRATEARHMEAFAAMVSDLDHHVGRMLDYLEESGKLDNTIIIFMSDNGYEGHALRTSFKEAANWADNCCINTLANIGKPDSYVWMGPNWSRASSAPFRYYKGFPTEGGTRVPFFIRYKGLKKKGVTEARGHVTDIMPTLLDLAHIKAPKGQFEGHKVVGMTGLSMRPLLTGTVDYIHPADQPFAQELFGKSGIRVGSMKAVHIWKPYGNGGWQLFDLSNDLAETKDLSLERPEELKKLISQWDHWAASNNVILPDWNSGY